MIFMRKNRFMFSVFFALPLATLLAAASSQSADSERLSPRATAPRPTIWQAASRGNLLSVQALIRSNPKLANAVDKVGNRPLNIAVFRADWAMMKYLIAKGADVNGVDGRGATPLHSAIAWDEFPRDRLTIVKYLVSRGADVQDHFTYGDTPLHFVKDAPVAQYLIGKGAQVNVRNTSHGLTPLHKAMYWLKKPLSPTQTQRLLQLIRVLIDNGANVGVKNKAGKRLLDDVQQIPSPELRKQVKSLLLQARATQ